MKYISLILTSTSLFIFIFACTHSEQKDKLIRSCNCPLKDYFPDVNISDSSYTYKDNSLFDWNVGGKVSNKISAMIDAEISANLSSGKADYQVSTKKVIQRIKNDNPGLLEKANYYQLNKLFFCAFYTILCDDDNLSSSELRVQSHKKLEEFRKEVAQIEIDETRDTSDQPPIQLKQEPISRSVPGKTSPSGVKIIIDSIEVIK
jgi:hypothetical protein